MKAIYSRISTPSQKHDRQLQNKNDYDFIYLDIISGSVSFKERPEAQKLLSNDKVNYITIAEVTRLGRNLQDILQTLQHFTDKGVNIHIENLGLTTLLPGGKPNPTAKLMINLLGTIGEYERELLKERTQQGREIAKAKGKYKGKKRGADANISKYKAKHHEAIQKVDYSFKLNNGISATARLTGITRTMIYRFIDKGLVKPPKVVY